MDEAQPAAAAGEELCRHLLEVARGGREGLLERVADALVRVPDQGLELAQRGLEVLALALELLDVRDRLGVFLLGERVDRPELLATPAQPLDPTLELRALVREQRLVARLRIEPELLGHGRELARALGRPIACLLRPDLAAGHL